MKMAVAWNRPALGVSRPVVISGRPVPATLHPPHAANDVDRTARTSSDWPFVTVGLRSDIDGRRLR
ncbi:hypothetical protein GCM10009848_20670 [Micromonospora lupini]